MHLTHSQLYNSSFKDIETNQIGLSMQWQANENERWHYAVQLENRHQNPERAWAYIDESLKLNDKPILPRQNHTTDGALPQYIAASNSYEGAQAAIHLVLSKTENRSGKFRFLKNIEILCDLYAYHTDAP